MEELWKDIGGYEGLYQVSNLGRIWSYKTNKILKGSIDSHGYRQVDFRKDGKRKTILLHRLVAKAFILNPDNLPQVNHKDENPLNNHVNNLEWCTQEYNLSYGTISERKSKKMSGENNPFYGKHHSEETIKMLKEGCHSSKKVYTVDGIFDSVVRCADFYNVSCNSMRNWLNNRTKKMPQIFVGLDLKYYNEL